LKDACPPGPPCHFYVTAPEDIAHAAFINVHTAKNVKSLEILYDELDYFEKHRITRFNQTA